MSENTEITVRINTIDSIKEFVNVVCNFLEDIDATDGRYIVNAKSIMGILSLNLLNPVNVTIHTDNLTIKNRLIVQLNDFIEEE